MPAKWFRCNDSETIEIEKCLSHQGCRMASRCATLPFLRLVGFDRKWEGISPSSAGNGPRQIYLKATTDYIIDPQARVWAAFGTSTHEKLSIHHYTHNVLSEEPLSDKDMKGIPDCLEEDENKPGQFVLIDYKNFGSYKVAKCLGIFVETIEETILDEEAKPILLKSGPNKGTPKTKQKKIITTDPSKIDLDSEELQLNRYRIFYESYKFLISKMQLQVMVRDGSTYIAKNRGIDKNLYVIPIKRLLNVDVLAFYKKLNEEVMEAFKTGFIRKCDSWESWDRRRCEGYCETVDACKAMSEKHSEKWGLI